MKANKHLTDKWREKIRLSLLITRLDQCAAGEIEMDKNQLKAAQMLLNKLVPDLARTELTGADGGALQLETRDMTAKVLKELPQEVLEKLANEAKDN